MDVEQKYMHKFLQLLGSVTPADVTAVRLLEVARLELTLGVGTFNSCCADQLFVKLQKLPKISSRKLNAWFE